MKLPNDPVMLLSAVNTALRDKYPSLCELAKAENADAEYIINKLSSIGYNYSADQNKFI